MTPEQTITLIAEIALADPRVRREDPNEHAAQVALWFAALGDVPHDFAVTAAHQHYRTSQWPITPNAIAERWNTHIANRADQYVDPLPAADPDDPQAYLAELKATRADAWTNVVPIRPPRSALGPGMPQVAALSFGEDDVRAMRMEGDLAQMWKGSRDRAHTENTHRKQLVLAHADLAARLTQKPLNFAHADQWTGNVPGDLWQGNRNDSPFAAALRALVTEAEARQDHTA